MRSNLIEWSSHGRCQSTAHELNVVHELISLTRKVKIFVLKNYLNKNNIHHNFIPTLTSFRAVYQMCQDNENLVTNERKKAEVSLTFFHPEN
jgi:pectate lyase